MQKDEEHSSNAATGDKKKKNMTQKEIEKRITLLNKQQSGIEANIEKLEKQIYALETSYLDDTKSQGNLVLGWDNYLSSSSHSRSQKKKGFKESDRLFSSSSYHSDDEFSS